MGLHTVIYEYCIQVQSIWHGHSISEKVYTCAITYFMVKLGGKAVHRYGHLSMACEFLEKASTMSSSLWLQSSKNSYPSKLKIHMGMCSKISKSLCGKNTLEYVYQLRY